MNKNVNMNEYSNVVHGEFRRGALARVIDQVMAWNERRIAIRHLSALSDRMLDDIGIDRYEISSVVRQTGSSAPINVDRPDLPAESAVIREAA
jgi:uncharacterized protein YjiS (DUF1127 family)